MWGSVASGSYPKAEASSKGFVWNKETGFAKAKSGPKTEEVSQKEIDQTTYLAIEAIVALADVDSLTTAANIRRAIKLLHPEVVVRDVALMRALQFGHRRGVFAAFDRDDDEAKTIRVYGVDQQGASQRDSTSKFATFVENLSTFARFRKQAIENILDADPKGLTHRADFDPDPLLDPAKSKTHVVTVPLQMDWEKASKRGILLNMIGLSTLEHTGAPPSGLSHFYVESYDANLPDMDEPKPRPIPLDLKALRKPAVDPFVTKMNLGAVGGNPVGRGVLYQRALTREESESLRKSYQSSAKVATMNGMKAEYVDMSLDHGMPPTKGGTYTINLF